jgi:proteasomal ATPase-associated factor 1
VIFTASSDLSIRIFAAKDGLNPRTLKGHTRAITSTHIIGVGKEVLSASKDGTIRLWNVGEGKETRQWKVEGKRAIERMIVLEEEDALASLGLEGEGRVILAASKDGITIIPWSKSAWFVASPPEVGHLLSIARSSISGLVATGHSDGVTILRPLSSLVQDTVQVSLKSIRRNQSPVYSLLFSSTTSDLFMGTAAGMPCRLGVDYDGGEISVSVKEEFAGWEAVGVECWAEGNGNVWCAGGEGGIRRY